MPKLKYRATLPRPDDPTILGPIVQLVRAGVPLKYAALASGISDYTAYTWVSESRHELEAAALSDQPVELSPQARFAHAVKQARAGMVVDEIAAWNSAGNLWAKHATKLERLCPEEFGRRDRVEQRSVSVQLQAQVPTEALPAIVARLQAVAALPSPVMASPDEPTDLT